MTAPLAEEIDPYLALNEKLEGVLADVEDLQSDIAKVEKSADFDPSILRGVLAAITGLTKKIGDMSAPTINVQAPAMTLPAPNVSIKTDTPKKWRVAVTERDENDRIKSMTIEAAD